LILDKYSPNGDSLFSNEFYLGPSAYIGDIKIDILNNVYIVYDSSYAYRLRKYDSNGAFQWDTTYNYGYRLRSIVLDDTNNVFVAGDYKISDLEGGLFISKFDNSGNHKWKSTFSYGPAWNFWIKSISVDNSGYIYVTGFTGWTVADIFLAKFDHNGNIIWDKKLGTDNHDEGWRVKNDSHNNIIVHGFVDKPWVGYIYTGWLGKFNTDGDTIFVKTTYQDVQYPSGLAIDSDNNIYISGFITGGSGGFVAKHNTKGAILWEFQPNNWNWKDIASSIDVDNNGNVYFIGDSSEFIIFGKIGIDTTTNIEESSKSSKIMNVIKIFQNYPNPFNPSTTIEFDLPKTSTVTLKIYNILGEEVTTVVSDRLNAGSYTYEWDASRSAGIASGVYLYRLQAGDFVETRKMVLMR
jgi:hypothetical protein